MSSRSKQPPQEEEQHPILSLPKEILELIFSYIPQNEALNLRLVCKSWNSDVETLYSYKVKDLDEDSRHFQRILELRIHKLSLSKLEETSVLNSQGISVFKHPKAIKILKIKRYSSVSPKNLQQLLSMCAKTVRIIHLHLDPQYLSFEFPVEEVLEGYQLPALKVLKLICSGSAPGQAMTENQRSLFQVLENSWMPQLKRLQIYFSTMSLCQPRMSLKTKSIISENILRILSRNGIRLEFLDIDIFNYNGDESELKQLPLTVQEEELNRIMQIDRVQEFDVRFKPFSLQLQNFWQQFLANQKQLVDLKTNTQFPGAPISMALYRHIILKNSATLVNITIFDLNLLPNDPPFDLSVFQACQNLKTLLLYRNNVPRTDPDQPDVRQFHCLPDSIENLILVSLKIQSEELLMGFTHGFKNLQKLRLDKCGMRGLLGVNWPVLSSILLNSRPSLTEVRFIDSVNSEDESLGIELRRIGLSRSDLDVLLRNRSAKPGHFSWISLREESYLSIDGWE